MCKMTFALHEFETADVVQDICEYYGCSGTTDEALGKIFTLTHGLYYTPNSGYKAEYDIKHFKETGELPYFFMRIYCSEVLGFDMAELERKALA